MTYFSRGSSTLLMRTKYYPNNEDNFIATVISPLIFIFPDIKAPIESISLFKIFSKSSFSIVIVQSASKFSLLIIVGITVSSINIQPSLKTKGMTQL